VLKGVDILVVLGLLRQPNANWTVRSLAAQLHLPPATVQRSLARLAATPIFGNRRLSITACEELLTHAVRYVAPGSLGGETRGVPTAWGAPPLAGLLARVGSTPVWPDPHGDVRGVELQPLHPAALMLARSDLEMHELLVLVDGLRVGDARVRELAAKYLHARIFDAPESPLP
jgi:hypothetical protein